MPPRLSAARWLVTLVPIALLAGAYISQYGFGLFPCEMCWWQRYAHFATLVPAGLSFVTGGTMRVWLVRGATVLLFAAGLLGGYHAGIEYGWWTGVTSCATNANSGGGSALDAIMNAPITRCDVAPWTFFGVSLAGWNFLISVSAAVAAAIFSAPAVGSGVDGT